MNPTIIKVLTHILKYIVDLLPSLKAAIGIKNKVIHKS